MSNFHTTLFKIDLYWCLVFGVICTFQSSQFFDRLSMHFGVVDHIRASALTTADRHPPSWNRITDSTHAPPVGNRIGEPH
jgi:hypothetical protein